MNEQIRSETHLSRRGVQVRLFLTCWLIYLLHFSPFVVRELYLTLSLAEKHSVRVDEYLDLHPDLFKMPGRGAFMGGNPGASILAAVPYWLSLPVANRFAPVRPPTPGEQVSAQYTQQAWNKVVFYRKVRQRGLDLHLGFAAMITSVFFMAPLSALSAVAVYGLLGRFGFSERSSLWLAVVYAFGTPIFFRTATLSLNLLVALLGLFSFILLWRRSEEGDSGQAQRYLGAGFLAGWAVLTDYTGVVTASLLGIFGLVQQLKRAPFLPAFKRSLWYLAGVIGPVAFLLFYQWYCYGNPWLPAQYHQPAAQYAGYPSPRGFGWPLPAAAWGLIFDPLYGLLVFAPLFALVLYHPIVVRRRQNLVPTDVAAFSWVFFGAFWLFCSCIDYTVRHQWQDGFRYMVPAIPFLFFLLADVLVRAPRAIGYLAGLVMVAETWCLCMVRQDPLDSILRVPLRGFELPWLTTLVRTAPQYFPFLAGGASPLGLFLLWAVLIWGIWVVRRPWPPIGLD